MLLHIGEKHPPNDSCRLHTVEQNKSEYEPPHSTHDALGTGLKAFQQGNTFSPTATLGRAGYYHPCFTEEDHTQ